MARKRTSSTKRWRDQARKKRQEDKAKRRAERQAAKAGSGDSSQDAPPEGEPLDEEGAHAPEEANEPVVQESPESTDVREHDHA